MPAPPALMIQPPLRHRSARPLCGPQAGWLGSVVMGVVVMGVVPGLCAAATVAPGPGPAAQRFSVHGLGPVQAGQTLAQAQSALREPLLADAPAAAPPTAASAAPAATSGCRYHHAAGQPGVRYAINQGVLSRVETRDPRYASLSGVAVGQPLAQARQAYGGRLVEQPHPYFDRGRLLLVHAADRRFALVMESNNDGRIITLRSGRLPDVQWLEGCS